MQSNIKLAQLGKKAPIITKYMGRRALQDIKGFTNMVISLDFRSSIVRVAIMAGTLQPNPIISGIKDLPCSPIRCIILSMINAARAIYPESSNIEIKKYNMRIFGRKTITPPTPPIIPSISKSQLVY